MADHLPGQPGSAVDSRPLQPSGGAGSLVRGPIGRPLGMAGAGVGLTLVALLGVAWTRSAGRGELSDPLPRTLSAVSAIDQRLDPNTASAADLALLPGIGPTLAQRIIQVRRVRQRAGQPGFESAADLLLIPGIGPKTLEQFEMYLKFNAQ